MLKPKIDNGYFRVSLSKNNRKKMFLVHRLVALMFIANPDNKPEVNHKNGIKTDNRASELEWATTKENITHSWNNGLHTVTDCLRETARKKGMNRSKKVVQYDLQGSFIKEWKSIAEADRQLNINSGNISLCCRQKHKTAGGYIWRYKEENLV